MNVFEFILTIAVLALVAIIIVMATTKKGRMFAKAAISSLFTEANKNPKIVAEYFDEKIDALKKNYAKADNAYRKAVGEYEHNQRQIVSLKSEKEQFDKRAIEAQKRGNTDDARRFARDAVAALNKIKAIEEAMPQLERAKNSASDLRNKAQDAIEQLKKRKETDIAKVKAGKAAQEIYDSFDASKINSDIDKVLNQFTEYADDQEKIGTGARIAWETSDEAQRIQAEKRAKEWEADEYIAGLIGSVTDENN